MAEDFNLLSICHVLGEVQRSKHLTFCFIHLQKAADRDMFNFNSLQVIVIALSNGSIANFLRRTV